MNRKEFLQKLGKRLNKLPKQQREEILQYYAEYFDEAGEQNEAEVIAELKSPAHLAARILAEAAEKQVIEGQKASKTGVKAFWFTLLAVLSAPITLPLLIGLLILLFTLSIMAWVFIPLMLFIAIGLVIAIVISIFTLPLTGLYFLAWLAIVLGSIILVFYLTKLGMQKIFTKLKSL